MCSLITAISFFLKLGRGLEPLGIHDNPISCRGRHAAPADALKQLPLRSG